MLYTYISRCITSSGPRGALVVRYQLTRKISSVGLVRLLGVTWLHGVERLYIEVLGKPGAIVFSLQGQPVTTSYSKRVKSDIVCLILYASRVANSQLTR